MDLVDLIGENRYNLERHQTSDQVVFGLVGQIRETWLEGTGGL